MAEPEVTWAGVRMSVNTARAYRCSAASKALSRACICSAMLSTAANTCAAARGSAVEPPAVKLFSTSCPVCEVQVVLCGGGQCTLH